MVIRCCVTLKSLFTLPLLLAESPRRFLRDRGRACSNGPVEDLAIASQLLKEMPEMAIIF